MSAFDEASGGGRAGRVGRAGGGRAPPSRGGSAALAPEGSFASAEYQASSGSSTTLTLSSAGSASPDSASFAALASSVESDLRTLSSTVATLRRQSEAIGTRGDSEDLRSRLNANLSHGHSLSKSIEAALNTKMPALLASDKSGSSAATKKSAHKKLLADFTAVVKEFREVATSAKRNTSSHPMPSSSSTAGVPTYGSSTSSMGAATSNPFASSSSSSSYSAPASSSGLYGGGRAGNAKNNEAAIMAQLQQVDLTEALMAEREQGIEEVSQEVVAVNEVMRDLAGLVNEQGKQLEELETNVTSAQKSTETGVGHLQQAAKYAGRYRKCLFGLVALLLLVAAGLTAYFLITNKNK